MQKSIHHVKDQEIPEHLMHIMELNSCDKSLVKVILGLMK